MRPEISIISAGARKNLLDDTIVQRLKAITTNTVYITKDVEVGSVFITNREGINVIKMLATKLDSKQH